MDAVRARMAASSGSKARFSAGQHPGYRRSGWSAAAGELDVEEGVEHAEEVMPGARSARGRLISGQDGGWRKGDDVVLGFRAHLSIGRRRTWSPWPWTRSLGRPFGTTPSIGLRVRRVRPDSNQIVKRVCGSQIEAMSGGCTAGSSKGLLSGQAGPSELRSGDVFTRALADRPMGDKQATYMGGKPPYGAAPVDRGLTTLAPQSGILTERY